VGHAGDLDVGDVRKVLADLGGDVPLGDLQVVEIHL